ncbi:MAG: alpha/beta hydrolase family protein [Acidobacteriota bacterium]
MTDSSAQAVYPLDPINGVWPTTHSSDWEVYGHDRAYEALPASAQKPFALVLFSPGWGGPIWGHNFLAVRAASHGFVVAVMYHYGDAFFLGEQFDHIAVASLNRPLDLSFVLTQLLFRNSTAGDTLYDLIDPTRVAASGWSLGGFAAMALAGGVDNLGYNTESELYPWEPPPPPETYVPIPRDPRIKSIVPLDGSNQMMQFFELARVTVPAMGMGQEWSTLEGLGWGYPWESWQARQHAAFQGHPSYRIDVAQAYHPSFSNLCTSITLAHDHGLLTEEEFDAMASWLCSAPLATGEANRVITKYWIAFLKKNLCRVQGYQHYLTPGYVLANEPGLEFFVTEKRNPGSIEDKWPDYFIYFKHQPGSETARAEENPMTPMRHPHLGLPRD